ncbi:MAG: hypothetical protein K0S99_2789, partial [Thermomicrobiales bacterium]|nr:hypothetical protein [Thermomicrobiales bacterium]
MLPAASSLPSAHSRGWRALI